MSKTTLNWGLLSTALINRALIPPLRQSRRNRLVAVGSRDEAKGRAFAQKWDISKVHGSYEALLADPEIDVIYNPLPNSLHAEWTIKAVRAGKHVLCEKPLACTLAEVDSMIAAAQETGKVIAEAFMYRHHAQTLKVREWVRSGLIGELRLVRGAFSFNMTDKSNIRFDPALGGGSIWDVGCYPISYARSLTGAEPIEASGWQVTGSTGIDEVFAGQLRFPGEVIAQFDSAFRSSFRMNIEVVGSQASLFVPNPFKPGRLNVVWLLRGRIPRPLLVSGAPTYQGEVEDMADAILLGKPPLLSLQDSRNNVAAILALLQSAQENRPVQLCPTSSTNVN